VPLSAEALLALASQLQELPEALVRELRQALAPVPPASRPPQAERVGQREQVRLRSQLARVHWAFAALLSRLLLLTRARIRRQTRRPPLPSDDP